MYLINTLDAYTKTITTLDVDDYLVGLVFMEDSDIFYAIDFRGGLYEIDFKFQATKLGTMSNLKSPSGLTLGPDGDIYAVTRQEGLFKIDPYNVTATYTETSLPWDNQSLAYGAIPEPTTLLFMALGSLCIINKSN